MTKCSEKPYYEIERAEKELVTILKSMPLNSAQISRVMDAVAIYKVAYCNNHKVRFIKPLLLERFKNMIEDV
jgi:hypothetical protein